MIGFLIKAFGGLAVVAGVGFYIFSLRADLAELKADLIVAQRNEEVYRLANEQTVESFNNYVKQTTIIQNMLARSAAETKALAVNIERSVAELQDVPEEANRPVSDIRYVTFERLRLLQQTTTAPAGNAD